LQAHTQQTPAVAVLLIRSWRISSICRHLLLLLVLLLQLFEAPGVTLRCFTCRSGCCVLVAIWQLRAGLLYCGWLTWFLHLLVVSGRLITLEMLFALSVLSHPRLSTEAITDSSLYLRLQEALTFSCLTFMNPVNARG
jgi:hypothetical protein